MLRDPSAFKGTDGTLLDTSVETEGQMQQDLSAVLSGGHMAGTRLIHLHERLLAKGGEWLLSEPLGAELPVTLSAPTIIMPVTRSDFSIRLDNNWHSHPSTAPVTASLLPKGGHFRIRQRDAVSILWIKLDEDWLKGLADRAGCTFTTPNDRVIGLAHPDLVSIASSARTHLTARSALSALFAECLAMTLVMHFLEKLVQPSLQRGAASSRTDRVARSVSYIDNNVSKPITIRELASEASMSPYHFARSFKDVVGVPPHRYVIQRRIEHAKMLLQNTKLSIAQVAFECGFSSQSHLTSSFKSETGFTPLRYRQSIIEK